MIDYEEKRSETRHRMGFMTPLLVFWHLSRAAVSLRACFCARPSSAMKRRGKAQALRCAAAPQRRFARERSPKTAKKHISQKI